MKFQIATSIMLRIPLIDEIESLANGREHAKAQDIHLHHSHFIDIVFVPFNNGPFGHGCIFNGNDFAERRLAENKSTHMLR